MWTMYENRPYPHSSGHGHSRQTEHDWAFAGNLGILLNHLLRQDGHLGHVRLSSCVTWPGQDYHPSTITDIAKAFNSQT